VSTLFADDSFGHDYCKLTSYLHSLPTGLIKKVYKAISSVHPFVFCFHLYMFADIFLLIIDRVVGDIIRLVASVCVRVSVRLSGRSPV